MNANNYVINDLSVFNTLKILIIGDVMIDAYEWGSVDRISPEAPVPLFNLKKTELRPGGAANVALNIKALGAEPVLLTMIGKDDASKDFLTILKSLDLDPSGIIRSDERCTTVKKRYIAAGQHILRVDHEQTHLLSKNEEMLLIEKINHLLTQCDAVIFEDYDKGVITTQIINTVVKLAKKLGKPVAVDPKKRQFLDYKGVALFKPNLKELREGLKIELDPGEIPKIELAIGQLHQILEAGAYMITLSEKGVFGVDYKTKEKQHISAHVREIADVSGAGDTVISVASLALAAGFPFKTLLELSNLAGGLVCEHLGVVPINKTQLEREALKLGIIG